MVFGSTADAEVRHEEATPVVGMVVPLEGHNSAMGEQLVESARWAAADREVAVEAVDEGESSGEVVRAIREFGERPEVVAVIGPVARDHGSAAARAARRVGLPLMVYSSRRGVELEGAGIFRARPSPDEQSGRIARYLGDEVGFGRIGLMAPHSEYGDQMVSSLIDALGERGATVAALARYQEDETDFRPVLETLLGVRADVGHGRSLPGRRVDAHGTVGTGRDGQVDFEALVIADFHQRVARILPFLPRVGIATAAGDEGETVHLVGPSGWRGDGLEMAADHARGAVFFDTFGGEADGARARRFALDFRDRTGREVTTPEAEVYDLVAVIAGIVEGTSTTGAVRDTLVERLRSGATHEGVTGDWTFAPTGAPVRTLQPYQVRGGGQWVPVSSPARDRDQLE